MTSSRQTIVSDDLYTRKIEGQVLFPHAISVSGARYVWLAGQFAYSKSGQIVGQGDMRAQFRQTCENIRTALHAADAKLEDVVKVVFYVTDMDEYFRCFDLRHEYFGAAFPVSSTIEVSRLAVPGAMIEIEAVAAVTR
jgi:2-iminobutanoate/2-iminopropanoate deaminase